MSLKHWIAGATRSRYFLPGLGFGAGAGFMLGVVIAHGLRHDTLPEPAPAPMTRPGQPFRVSVTPLAQTGPETDYEVLVTAPSIIAWAALNCEFIGANGKVLDQASADFEGDGVAYQERTVVRTHSPLIVEHLQCSARGELK